MNAHFMFLNKNHIEHTCHTKLIKCLFSNILDILQFEYDPKQHTHTHIYIYLQFRMKMHYELSAAC